MPRFKIPATLVVDYVVTADTPEQATADLMETLRAANLAENSRKLADHPCKDVEYELAAPEKLPSFFTVEFTVRYRAEAVEAEDEDDARYEVEANWQYMDKEEIDFEVDDVDAEEE